jgi:hypothetical protein
MTASDRGVPLIVMPGLDPGIRTSALAARDTRIKSGYDDEIDVES